MVFILELSSTDFAKAIGVSITTLYNWEKKGIIAPIRTSITGHRVYSEEQLQAYLNEDYNNPILKGHK